ncbi:MbnP family protein [Hydrocarboniphaga sp.]|uniref:MbnP family protein n=1 Tax=Hydrocarboniphaga sp. TaxID=2033016 RepID=UPI002633EFD3|nr:MbnP family protein [Hydrocarboniphaga sp.]
MAAYLTLAAALSLGLAACNGGNATQPLHVEISHVVGEQPLQLGSDYALADGDHLSIDKLRYYLSNFRLRRHDGSWSAGERSERDARAYFLVDESQPGSKTLSVDGFAAGDYEGLEFLIGVDAARNAAGAQTGALDPEHGMFWTWNTGYIFFKLEGHSPQSTATGHSLSYHIGGSREPANNARTVYLPLGTKPLKLAAELTSTVHLHADIAALFQSPSQSPDALSIAEHANIMDPAGGKLVADRYAELFRVDHVHHEPRH